MIIDLTAIQIQTICQAQWLADPFNGVIKNVVTDSRQASNETLFVALAGQHHHGHDFIPQVINNGCQVILAEKSLNPDVLEGFCGACLLVEDTLRALGEIAAYCRQQFAGSVVTVTGSCGKTTSKQMLHSVFSNEFSTHCTLAILIILLAYL